MRGFESRSRVHNDHTSSSRVVHEIGRYTIDGYIGEGGYSHVVAAHGPRNEKVALKFFKRENTDRFDREVAVHAAAQRFMPNAVPLLGHDIFFPNGDQAQAGVPYSVMERAERSLWDAIQQDGALEVDTALDVVDQAAEGLQVLYEDVGMVHSDVKPPNLLVAGDVIWISDFGGAVYPDEDADFQCTAPYAAPEQLFGEITPATDQYGLAVTLVEAISGTPPFDMDSGNYRATLLSSEYPAYLATMTELVVPPELQHPVRQAMQADPDLRFPSVTSFAEDLRNRRRETRETRQLPVTVFDMNRLSKNPGQPQLTPVLIA